MKTFLVNYASERFRDSQKSLNESALRFGIDEIFSYTTKDIKKTAFYARNRKILSKSIGAGYWLWKPYILLESLRKIPNDSLLMYADAGMNVIGNLDPLFEILIQKEVLTFNINHLNRRYTKRDCFVLMGCDTERYWSATMRDAGLHLYKKTDRNLEFLTEWMRLCEDERLLTDMDNTQGLPNLDGFIAHRHDQSIFSLLAEQSGFEAFRDPSQFGNHLKSADLREMDEFTLEPYSSSPYLNSPYRTLFDRHRKKSYRIFQKIKGRVPYSIKRALVNGLPSSFYAHIRKMRKSSSS